MVVLSVVVVVVLERIVGEVVLCFIVVDWVLWYYQYDDEVYNTTIHLLHPPWSIVIVIPPFYPI